MKATGIVRNVDSVGRFVLPAEMREVFGIKKTGGKLEMFVEDDKIILKKFEPTCIFCGSEEDVNVFKDKKVCKKCMREMSQAD